MLHKVKVEAKDVSLAIEKGLKKLGLRRDQVEVSVLENPRKGFLGIGARPAVVEVRQKRWVSSNLDAQIYMDVPKKKRSNGKSHSSRNSRHGGRGRKHEEGVREIKRGGRRSYGAGRGLSADKALKTNEAQLLPALEIQNAVVPEYLKAPLQEAKDFLNNVLSHMGVTTENLNAWWDEKQHRILLTFDCDHPAIVIGKEGKTLESLQYLATLSLSRHFDKPISVIADTQNYWRKAEDKINADLEYGINQIKNGYSVYRFRPMSAQLRRYIHRAAENNEFVITLSEGEGQWRKVTLRPRPADQPVQQAPAEEQVAVEENAQQVAQAPAETMAPVAEETPAVVQEMPQVTATEETTEVAVAEPVAEQIQEPAVEQPLAEPVAVQEVPVTLEEPVVVEPTLEQSAPEAPAGEQAPVANAEPTPAPSDCGPLFDSVSTEETK